jgi:hypothetical protein
MNAPRWSTTDGWRGVVHGDPPSGSATAVSRAPSARPGIGHRSGWVVPSGARAASRRRPSAVGCPLHARASVVVLAGWSVGCPGCKRASGVGRRSKAGPRRVLGLQAGVGRRASFKGRPPSGARAASGRRSSVVGRRAMGGPLGARAASGRRASAALPARAGEGRRVSGVGRRASGVGCRASGVGRRSSGAARAPRHRASGVGRLTRARAGEGRRASGVGRSGFLKCFYEFFCFLLIYTLHFVIPSIK